ncbi:hypothetical protein DFH07DRAFT_744744 [Mycena maculata]|uniref:Uncharacterized protein n=1 Tax=Mycena maculata TaxID=230809 RepID=A0AAD7IZX4_9AGAR|nr:hypothetical protein DFH07DRAFT_744744 [Mycena maculata]
MVQPLTNLLSFAGKTAVVTGANAGLGRAASLHHAQHQISTLILAVRAQRTGEETKAALLAEPVVRALQTKSTIIFELSTRD